MHRQTGVEVDVLDASIEALDLTKNKDFEAMAKEGGEKMHKAVEAAMKKFNIKPPGPPPGLMGPAGKGGMGGGPPGGGSMPPMPGAGGTGGSSGSKRSSSPYKQRRF